eukprot:1143638-Pelagomonas_calceolata.AAC.5
MHTQHKHTDIQAQKPDVISPGPEAGEWPGWPTNWGYPGLLYGCRAGGGPEWEGGGWLGCT